MKLAQTIATSGLSTKSKIVKLWTLAVVQGFDPDESPAIAELKKVIGAETTDAILYITGVLTRDDMPKFILEEIIPEFSASEFNPDTSGNPNKDPK